MRGDGDSHQGRGGRTKLSDTDRVAARWQLPGEERRGDEGVRNLAGDEGMWREGIKTKERGKKKVL